jgi:hypothetical protein
VGCLQALSGYFVRKYGGKQQVGGNFLNYTYQSEGGKESPNENKGAYYHNIKLEYKNMYFFDTQSF